MPYQQTQLLKRGSTHAANFQPTPYGEGSRTACDTGMALPGARRGLLPDRRGLGRIDCGV